MRFAGPYLFLLLFSRHIFYPYLFDHLAVCVTNDNTVFKMDSSTPIYNCEAVAFIGDVGSAVNMPHLAEFTFGFFYVLIIFFLEECERCYWIVPYPIYCGCNPILPIRRYPLT